MQLYDALGRIDSPEHADIELMEDMDTGRLPSALGTDVDPLEV